MQSIQRAKIYGGEYSLGVMVAPRCNASIKQDGHFFSKRAQKFFLISLVRHSGDLPLSRGERIFGGGFRPS